MNLKELRKYKGFSQETAAKSLGIPLRTYKRYETEKSYENTYKYGAIYNKLLDLEKPHKNSKQVYKSNVLIVGAGYVGYNFGKVLSKKCDISFLDIDENKVVALHNEGYDAYSKLSSVNAFNVAVICLPTNFNEETKTYDTREIKKVISDIFEINKNCLVIIKSTISVGFTNELIEAFNKEIYFMPEFLREKTAYEDSLRPIRLIIGANKVNSKITSFSRLVENCIEVPRKTIFMSTNEAEATKLYSNAYLAMRLAFFNELDTFAIKENMDTKNIIKGIGLDPRIGDYYNDPGFGFGGYCLPKDTKVIQTQSESELLGSVISSNNQRKEFIASEIIKEALHRRKRPTIGIIDTEKSANTHKSTLVEMVDLLRKYSVNVIVFDENVDDFDSFCSRCHLIVSNKKDPRLDQYKSKVFNRSIY